MADSSSEEQEEEESPPKRKQLNKEEKAALGLASLKSKVVPAAGQKVRSLGSIYAGDNEALKSGRGIGAAGLRSAGNTK